MLCRIYQNISDTLRLLNFAFDPEMYKNYNVVVLKWLVQITADGGLCVPFLHLLVVLKSGKKRKISLIEVRVSHVHQKAE